jgi:uncharacterized protein (DUF2147 family)
MFASLAAAALAASPATVTGDWINQDHSALVRIAPCGAQLCGTVVRVLARGRGVPTTDVNNSDPRLRSRPLVGLRVLSGFTQAGTRWEGGRAYDPKSGNSYRARLEPSRDGTLTVTGCVLFVCRSQAWTRAGG